jgi:hypothetical protein
MPLTIDGQANSITSSVGGVNIPATVGTLSVGPSGSYMNVTSSGVGIGTLTPQAKLHVGGTSGSPQFRAGTATNGYLEINAFNSNPVYCVIGGSNATAGVFGTQSNIPTIFFTNNTEVMRIDTAGRVTMPSQPAFFSRPTGNYDIVVGETTIGGTWNDVFDRGNNFSNGTFTAPVAGVYQFSWAPFLTLETTRQDAYIMVNGTGVMREEITGYNSTSNRSGSVHGIYQLSANDTVTFGVQSTAGNTIYATVNPWCYACGYLIG